MNRKLIAVVGSLAMLVSLGGSSLPASAAAPEPIKVHRVRTTQAHVAAMVACLGNDDTWPRYKACQDRYPVEQYRCTRDELWYGERMVIVRDDC